MKIKYRIISGIRNPKNPLKCISLSINGVWDRFLFVTDRCVCDE